MMCLKDWHLFAMLATTLPILGMAAPDSAKETETFIMIGDDGVQSIPISAALLSKFDLLNEQDPSISKVFDFTKAGTALPFIKPAVLQNLFKIIDWHTSEGYSPEQLIEIIYLADYLMINDWSILQPALDHLKAHATIDLVQKINAFGFEIRVPLNVKLPNIIKEAVLPNTYTIHWQPNSTHYWMRDTNFNAQLYRADDTAVHGHNLTNVLDIYWQPDSTRYWVLDGGLNAQLYNLDGSAVPGRSLTNVHTIAYQPNSTNYWVIDRTFNAQFYNHTGTAIAGRSLTNVFELYWQPSGQHFWKIDIHLNAQLYHATGWPDMLGRNLTNVIEIYWQPSGQHFWAIDTNFNAQLYNKDGAAVPEHHLENVHAIAYRPNSDDYWVIDQDFNAQLYSGTGAAITGQYLTDALEIYWQPNGTSFYVLDHDRKTRIYSSTCNHLTLTQQILVQVIINQFKANDKKPVSLSPLYIELLPTQIIDRLRAKGYLQAVRTGAGAGAGDA